MNAPGTRLLILVLAFAGLARADEKPPLRLVQTIPLPNVTGRIDHLTVDLKGNRLFVAALGNNTVEVIDLRAVKQVRSIDGFSKPQGVYYVPTLNKLFVASGNDGTCKIFRGDTLELLDTVKLSLGADLVDYNPAGKQIFVGHGGKDAGKEYGDVAVIDARSGKQLGEIMTEAHPGAILVEPSSNRVFVTIPDTSQVVVMDRKKRVVMTRWTITDAQRTVSLALDEANHRLFVGSRTPPKILVLDTETGKVVASMPSVGTMDGLFYDSAQKRIYASGGEGFVDVHTQVDGDHYEPLAKIPTTPIARTALFVPELKRLFVAVPRGENQEAEIRVFEVRP